MIRPKGSRSRRPPGRSRPGFATLIDELAPDCAAVESGFTAATRNPASCSPRAVEPCSPPSVAPRIPVHPYTPAQVKSAMVGHGNAEKHQVAFMVVRLLGLNEAPPSDAADAAGVALTHVHSRGPTAFRKPQI